ncbi:hypothetical protein [Aliamphritea spongicola]|nr:hypothetical protein [Aliamphritea spongicola]
MWPFILVTVLIGVCLFGGAYLLQFWTFASPVEMTVSGLTALLLAVMAGGLSWKFWGQAEAPEEDAEQRQRKINVTICSNRLISICRPAGSMYGSCGAPLYAALVFHA